MGREIRRVPVNWEHPKDENGDYKSMYDETFEDAGRRWVDNCIAWDNGIHEDLQDDDGAKNKEAHPFYWEWDGNPPDRELCRPAFLTEPTHYQIYQTVSEGTPTSPVFASLDEMKDWLVSEEYSEKAASAFVEEGYASSMVFVPGKGISRPGIHSLDF